MSDIFLSYSRKDQIRVAPLLEFLTSRGLDVWWDKDINPGDSFEDSIDKHILDSKCVVVVWSENSINSLWVKNEALEGLERNILVPIMLDEIRIPVAFKQTLAADFTSWPDSVEKHEVNSFLAAISSILDNDEPIPLGDIPVAAAMARKRSFLPVLYVVAALVLAGLYWAFNAKEVAPEHRLAILRFSNITDVADTYLADSLSSELYTRLNHLEGLGLASQFASWDVPHGSAVSEISSRLDVTLVLGGKLMSAGSSTGLMVTLNDVDGEILWQREYDASAANLQVLTQRIADHLVNELDLPISDDSELQVNRTYTASESAYASYLRGQDLLRQSSDQETLILAGEHFERAIGDDNRFARAYSGLCRVNLALYEGSRDTREFENAERSCNRALTLEPSEAEAYLALGELYLYSGQAGLAESQVRKAISINPDDVDAHLALGMVLGELDRHSGALFEFDLAKNRQPGYWRSFNLSGVYHYQRGEFPQAIEDFTQVTLLDPDNTKALNNLGTARYLDGQFAAAIDAWQKSEAINPSRSAYANMGTGYYFLKDFDRAALMYEKAIAVTPDDHRLWGNLADVERIAGREDAARENYEKAIQLALKDLAINNSDAETISRLAVYYAALKSVSEAESYVAATAVLAVDDPFAQYSLTVAYLLLGQTEQALEIYRGLAGSGIPEVLIKAEPMFDSLRQLQPGSTESPQETALDVVE